MPNTSTLLTLTLLLLPITITTQDPYTQPEDMNISDMDPTAHGLDPENMDEFMNQFDLDDPNAEGFEDDDELMAGGGGAGGEFDQGGRQKEEYMKKKKEGKYLITRLQDAADIIEDITHGMNVVIFVENKPEELLAKEDGQGLHKRKLIERLKSQKEHPGVMETAFYFSDCTVLMGLCEEMLIDETINQVVHVSKYVAVPVNMDNENLGDLIWERIANTFVRVADIAALDQLIAEKNGRKAVVFNPDTEASEEMRNAQTQMIISLVHKCKQECFDRFLYVELDARNEFLSEPSNQNRAFLYSEKEFIDMPFDMNDPNPEGLIDGIKFLNNEALDYVLENNSANYFKIYQNDMKAIVALILNTDDADAKQRLTNVFTEASKAHKKSRQKYMDRYTFVITDLKSKSQQYKEMLLEVTGEVKGDAEVYIFSRGNEVDKYENFRLETSQEDVANFLNTLETRIANFKELEARTDLENAELTDEQKYLLEYGASYINDWNSIAAITQNESDSETINVKNLLGFLNANDVTELNRLFYKSEEENREHNDKHLSTGLLHVTGDNLERLIFNKPAHNAPFPEMTHSFILVVCKNKSEEEKRECDRVGEIMHFLRQNFPKEDAEVRVGILDHVKNDHGVVDRFNIESFPVLIFFGRKDEQKRGKIFRGKLVVEKVIKWLNRKFLENEETELKLSDEQYKELLVLTSESEE